MGVYQVLGAVQSELKAPKSQTNNFGHYKYRSCEDIVEAAKPVCAKHGAVIYLTDTIKQIGDRYYVEATATFVEVSSSENVSVTALAREPESKKGMDEPQITGTASSYARKYALSGLLSLDDTKDSDSNENRVEREIRAQDTPVLPAYQCEECGAVVTEANAARCKAAIGRVLCGKCAREAVKGATA